jgi:hypothetical protein
MNEFVSQVVFFSCMFCLLRHLLVHFRFSITVLVYDYQGWWFIVNVYYFVSLFGSLKRYKSPALLCVFPASFVLLLPSNISSLHNIFFVALTILCFIVIANASKKIYYPCCVSHCFFTYSFNVLILLCFIDLSRRASRLVSKSKHSTSLVNS